MGGAGLGQYTLSSQRDYIMDGAAGAAAAAAAGDAAAGGAAAAAGGGGQLDSLLFELSKEQFEVLMSKMPKDGLDICTEVRRKVH